MNLSFSFEFLDEGKRFNIAVDKGVDYNVDLNVDNSIG
jgi:hypothetical protein